MLAQEAPILLLDEPTAALDIRHQERAMTVARSFADSGGAVVAVLHDLNLAAAYSDRIMLLDGGRPAGIGPPWAVLREDLLGSVFGHPVSVTRSPSGDAPLVVPVRLDPGAADPEPEPELSEEARLARPSRTRTSPSLVRPRRSARRSA